MHFISGLSILLAYQLIGEVLVILLNLSVPGPVLGMGLLLLTLLLRKGIPVAVESTADELIKHLSLLFIPAGVGLISYAHIISSHWISISLTIIASSLLCLGISAALMQIILRSMEKDQHHD